MTLDRDTEDRRSLASAIGGDVSHWWHGLSSLGKWARAIMSVVILGGAIVTGIRGAASMIVQVEQIKPTLERHDTRITTLEDDTTEMHGLMDRVDEMEQVSQERNRLLNNLEVRMDRVEAKTDRILCYVEASAENTSAFQCG